MKQKITFLSIILALLGISQVGYAQPIYQQSFDSPQFPPAGWTMATPPGNIVYTWANCNTNDTSWFWLHSNTPLCANWNSFSIAAHSGAGMAAFGTFMYNPNTYQNISSITTPVLNFSTPGASYKVSFWMVYDNVYSNADILNIYVTSSPTGPFTTPIATLNPFDANGTDDWKHFIVDIPASFNGATNYVTFEAVGSGQGEYRLDDVSIDQYLSCGGTPAPVITGPSSVCGGISFTLADSTAYYNTGVTYRWQSRLTGSTNFADVQGANALSLTTAIGLPTDFRLISTCTNSNKSDTTAPFSVGINSFYNCYCGPSTNVNLGGSVFPLIDSVSVVPSTLANNTPGTLPNYYASYPATGHTTTNLQLGATYTIKSFLSNFGANCQAWVDFDQNGTFDPSEWVDMTTPGTSNVSSGSFTVPTTATTGLTGLRIRSGGTSAAGSVCDNHDGETEDYVVNLVPAPPNDMAATLILQPLDNSSICANTNFVVKAVIQNLGTASQSNVVVKATYGDGSVNNTIYANDQNTIASFATDTVTIGTMSIPAQGTYTLKAYTTLANDLNTLDDTAYSSIRVKALPVDPVAISDTVCLGDTARIGVSGPSGDIFNWYNAPVGGSVLFTGNSYQINSLANTTVYYVSSSTSGVVSHLPSSALSGTEGCSGGITFDVTALTNLTVDSFAARFNNTGLQQVNVYYRAGSAAGNETNPNAWILVGSAAVNVTSTSSTYFVNVHVPLPLTSGDTYGFYLNYDAAYSDAAGTSTYTDANMQVDFTNGLGLCGLFSSPSSTNMFFNGSVYYHVGGSDCESNRIPVVAAVGPHPVIDLGTDRTVCQSPSLMLDAGNPGGSYLWNTGDTTQTIHITASGQYSVVVNRYCTASASVNLTVEPQPYATGINYQRSGTTYYFAVSGAQNVTGYYWEFGDGGTSTDSTPVHTYPTDGYYNITMVVYNNCGTDTVHWQIPTSVGTVSKNDNSLILYPNPASSKLTIVGDNAIEINDVMIINTLGTVVYRGDIRKAKSGTIDISKLSSGHYILRANTSEGVFSQPFDVLRQ